MDEKNLRSALETLKEKYGITVFKLEIGAILKEMNDDVERIEFESLCKLYNLEPDDFGKVFALGKVSYRIKGIKPRAPKYPIIATNIATGKDYKIRIEDVLIGLGRN